MRLLCRCARGRVQQHDKSIDPSDHRKSKTIRKICSARVNIRRNAGGFYRYTSVDLNHNHPALIDGELPVFNPPTEDQKALVQELVSLKNLKRRDIYVLLQSHFPEHPLNMKQISNLLDAAKRSVRDRVNDVGGDMVALVAFLMKKKEEDPRWVVFVEVDGENRFHRLFFMSPTQRDLLTRFSDVIINDVALMRNKYNLPLNNWVVIDHQQKTRSLAYALHTTETIEDHKWAVDHLFSLLPPHPSRVYFSDFDLAVDHVMSSKDVWHGLCLHHLGDNITKNLAPVLGVLFQPFSMAFWQVYYSISPDAFDVKWAKLLEDFPRSRDYLERVLGPTKERWAWAWVSARFTCGVRTSGRVESENRINKLLGDTKTGLYDLVRNLIERAEEQAGNEKLNAIKVRSWFTLVTHTANCCCE